MFSLNQKIANNESFKLLNFICTSRSDYHELKKSHWKSGRIANWIYLLIVFCIIILSFLPLFYLSNKDEDRVMKTPWMISINSIVFVVLVIDYLLRWITYPVRVKSNSINPLFFFIFTASSVFMLLSLISATMFLIVSTSPTYNVELVKGAKALQILKIFRLLLLLNIFPSFKIFTDIFIKNRSIVFSLLFIIFLLTFILALIIYSVEFEKNSDINNYGDALYYTLITLSTVGFGDVVCVTGEGKFLSILVAIMGSVTLSIPFGIVVVAFNTKVSNKYGNLDQSDIYGTITLAEKAYIKFFKRKHAENVGLKRILIIENYGNTDLNDPMFIRIKDLLGGDDNIENVFIVHNDFEIHINDKTKIDSDIYLVANLLKIKIRSKN